MIEKILLIFRKSKYAKKLKGKKPAIIIDNSIFYIKSIYEYNQQNKKNISSGYEFLLIKSKSANKTSQKSKEIKFFFGKILARSSSDLLSILANRLISDQQNFNYKLIQYPIYQMDSTKKLIVLTELSPEGLSVEILKQIENNLAEFFKKFRLSMSKIIETNV